MYKREDILTEARRWVGTPFHHQGRALGVGVDCAGVVAGIAHNLGISDFDRLDYAPIPNKRELEQVLDEHLMALSLPDPRRVDEPAAVLLMQFAAEPQHVAILTERDSIIHAYSRVGRCVEHRFAPVWRGRVIKAYRFPGVC